MATARAYGVLQEESGVSFRGLFIIDGKQNLRQITVNDLPVGRSVDETLRLVQAFQYTDSEFNIVWDDSIINWQSSNYRTRRGLPSKLESEEQLGHNGSRPDSLQGLLQDPELNIRRQQLLSYYNKRKSQAGIFILTKAFIAIWVCDQYFKSKTKLKALAKSGDNKVVKLWNHRFHCLDVVSYNAKC